MLRLAVGRHRLEGIAKWISTTQRHRSGGNRKNAKPVAPSYAHGTPPVGKYRPKVIQSSKPFRSSLPLPPPLPIIQEAEVIPFFQSEVTPWASKPETRHRLTLFGLPEGDARALLAHFAKAVKSGALSNPSDFEYYQLSRFSMPHKNSTSIDHIYSTIFFWWASTPETRGLLEKVPEIQSESLDLLRKITQATDRSFPADEFPAARSIRRTIIMHVGPTNSGKTHHALRALAAAPTGVYAGPLRLLAHEIWERLNTGQILPLGIDPDPRSMSISRPTFGDPRYMRLCNLITGEEQRFMDEQVPLTSCTIEMLSYRRYYDVAVIDEIQMLAEEERASAWVFAVLGVHAKEVHLCGEETAIPIVQELLKHTGDEVIIRRYERLSPLIVEEESLHGKLSKVQKGDCIVTFTRKSIFYMKEVVERVTGMRCAVVYGRLPPEIRSEQAALFNDPKSGYDVLIGSDAIGMGLNLKIKRIIFDTVSKWSGTTMIHLPVSAVKQIAGRAGRFGLHGSDGNAGGTVTTLNTADLPYLKSCVTQPYEPLPCAYIGHTGLLFAAIVQILPNDALMTTVLQAPLYAGRLPLGLRYQTNLHKKAICEFLDSCGGFSINERLMLLNAPIPWREVETSDVIKRMLRTHAEEMCVKLSAIHQTPFYEVLQTEERKMAKKRTAPCSQISLLHLEFLHKIVVFYLWMHYRFPVVYADYEDVSELKSRVEKVLTWCLENLSAKKREARQSPQSNRPALNYMTRTDLRKLTMSRTG